MVNSLLCVELFVYIVVSTLLLDVILEYGIKITVDWILK